MRNFKKRPKFLITQFSGCNYYHIRICANIDRIDWILIIVAIGLVLSFEAINTSIEFVVDLITTDYHEYAKYAKDIAAFSVVIVSIVSICIGLIVFLPYILEIFKGGM